MTVADRRREAAQALPEDVDGLLVTNLVNVRYLTGFTGSSGALIISRDGTATLATDGRYRQQAQDEAPDLALLITRSAAPDLVSTMSGCRVGIERRHVTLALYDVLAAAGPHGWLVGTDGVVETLRQVKDADELDALAEACRITDLAFSEVLAHLREGTTERQIAWRLLESMRGNGAEDAAFDSIVAFGPNSSIPHHRPTDRPLCRGDLVKLDFGARIRGYHADMTRTVVCGRSTAWQRELHAQVLSAQENSRAAVVVGAIPVELDGLMREFVASAGYEVPHGLGHGVGLEIHEAPFLVPDGDRQPLQRGTACTVEPGIYLPGLGGVRIEDTVVVGDAASQPLTQSSRELAEV